MCTDRSTVTIGLINRLLTEMQLQFLTIFQLVLGSTSMPYVGTIGHRHVDRAQAGSFTARSQYVTDFLVYGALA